jgi:hypothetical protein
MWITSMLSFSGVGGIILLVKLIVGMMFSVGINMVLIFVYSRALRDASCSNGCLGGGPIQCYD